jgi:hypothetical protein
MHERALFLRPGEFSGKTFVAETFTNRKNGPTLHSSINTDKELGTYGEEADVDL